MHWTTHRPGMGLRRTLKLVAPIAVVLAAATCGGNETSTPTSPTAAGTFPFGLFDTAGAPILASLSINPSVFKGGESTRGTVTLSAAAPAGGLTVALAADDTAATVPASMTVAEGASTGTFVITSKEIPAEVRIRITATAEGTSLTAWIRVTTRTPMTLTVDPVRIIGGEDATATVTIKSSAPAGGTVVRLASEGGDAIVPSTMTIAQGARSGTFAIQTRDVSRDTEVWIHASEGADTGSVQIRLVPRRPTSGGSGSGSITLGGTIG